MRGLDPRIHDQVPHAIQDFVQLEASWIAGSSPAMTMWRAPAAYSGMSAAETKWPGEPGHLQI
jgi:hypothetical protein